MRIKLQSNNCPNNQLKELSKRQLWETMCNVTIVVESLSFLAHKTVLACMIRYFRKLFLSIGLDATRIYVVDIITPGNAEKILSFVYTSEPGQTQSMLGSYAVTEYLSVEDHFTFPDLESPAVATP